MNKHKIYGIWHRIKKSSLIILLITFLLSAIVSVYALRSNNLKMTQLRQQLYIADENNTDVNEALNNLRSFVFSHMNTNLQIGNGSEEPIQLVHSYDRAVKAAQAQAVTLGTGQANQVYSDAQRECEKANLVITERVSCIQNYVSSHAGGITQINLPPKEAFVFDFASPMWSPDMAGWSLIVTAILGLALIARLVVGIFMKHYLRH
jgi:hypothetical protein